MNGLTSNVLTLFFFNFKNKVNTILEKNVLIRLIDIENVMVEFLTL